MVKKRNVIIAVSILLLSVSCERPSSPDFELQQSFDIPLIKNTTYKFIGDGKGAIIDTTSESFKDLFTTGSDGLVFLSTEVDFEIGDFEDIIPVLIVDQTDIEGEIGNLEVDEFSSTFASEIGELSGDPEELEEEQVEIGVFQIEFRATGTADFEKVTGLDESAFGPGDPVPGPETETFLIELDVPGFERAIIDSGGVRFFFSNDLGFDIQSMSASLISDVEGDARPVGSTIEFGAIPNGETRDDVIQFSHEEELEVELAFEIQVSWESQLMQTPPGDITAVSEEEDLVVMNATGNISAQVLRPEKEPITSSNPNFEYAIVSDTPGPGEAFQLEVFVENNTALPLYDSTLTRMPFITIFNSDGDVLDEPKELTNLSRPGASSLDAFESAEVTFDLTGQKMTRELTYDISIGTSGGAGLTLDRDDFFVISPKTSDLKFSEGRSDIDPQEGIPLEDTKDVEGDFVNAEVDEGELVLEIRNESNIPLVIDHLRFFNEEGFTAKNTGRTFVQGSDIAELSDITVPAQQTRNVIVPIENTGISNRISYIGTASSPGTTETVTVYSTDLVITRLEGSVQLRSATAVLKPQHFSISGEVELDEDEFRLEQPDHFIEIESGMIKIGNIVNDIDLDIDTLVVSFPEIRKDSDGSGRYHPADSLWFEFSGENRIRRSSDTRLPQPEISHSLENVRIYARNNRLQYNIVAITENTRDAAGADTVRTVYGTDRFRATADITGLKIKTAFGKIEKRVELIGDDEGEDGILDLFNDNEATVSEFSDFEELSERISGLQLLNPSFDLIYDTNLGVEGTIIAAILGINEKGEEVYLSAKPGSEREVGTSDPYQGLYAKGVQIPRSDLISFGIEPAKEIGELVQNQVVRLDSENSNVEDFLSNLPVLLRFIGSLIVNPDDGDGFIVSPIHFDARMGVDIPINLKTKEGQPATIEDIIDVDLSDMPSPEDDTGLIEAVLYIMYENGLPFDAGFTMEFLDENENVITTGHGTALDPVSFQIEGARVDAVTRFVNQSSNGMTEIRLTREQLDYLHKTHNIRLFGSLGTSRDDISGEVKVRTDDYIGLSINASFKTSVKVN